ncbi:mandelate racemase/muconate lactonizing enzyme family protein [Rhodophyticola sp. CCM32]|uniref:mandelate racemase/muconate lactonizing enzyme family protein n=1 Tax=Rhodophyticola sp. CCM32 TaxID=2916397 RepID=UPI001AEFE691|nr:mandelate racemase/muconate lactonizing enzyme family protein [Rhodophyticola sp. CCM32]
MDHAFDITAIRHWIVHVPLSSAISWSSGKRTGSTRLICEVTTRGGIKGYGETICLLDFVPVVFEKLVVPTGLGRKVTDVEQLTRAAEGAGYYHHKRALVFALSALEMAMWDARGKYADMPLHEMWGGAYRSEIEICAYVYISDPEKVAEELIGYRDQGFRSFKLKVGLDPEQDIALVRKAREVLGPSANLRVDPNGAWTPAMAKRMMARLAPYDLQYLEQPLPVEDIAGAALLRAASPVPICIDEGAYTLQETMTAIRMGAADVILVDPHETGGLWSCLKAGAVCEAAGIHVGMHSGGELGLTQAAYLHLAASMPNAKIALDTIYQHHADDILKDRIVFENGHAAVPTGPGLGVEVDLDKIAAYETDTITSAYLNPDKPDWFAEKPAF